MRFLILLHAGLMLLACTNFTIITFPLGGESWTLNLFQYASKSGFGAAYVSDYHLSQVLTYLASYAAGAAGFSMLFARGRTVTGLLGLALCVLGLVSFLLEGSHWLFAHNRSWIATAPVAMIVLSIVALVLGRPAVVASSDEATLWNSPDAR
jgi:hypothetical protein